MEGHVESDHLRMHCQLVVQSACTEKRAKAIVAAIGECEARLNDACPKRRAMTVGPAVSCSDKTSVLLKDTGCV